MQQQGFSWMSCGAFQQHEQSPINKDLLLNNKKNKNNNIIIINNFYFPASTTLTTQEAAIAWSTHASLPAFFVFKTSVSIVNASLAAVNVPSMRKACLNPWIESSPRDPPSNAKSESR